MEEMLPDALEVLTGCSNAAIAMADKAGRAAEIVAQVSKLGENALFSAKGNLGANAEKGKEIDDLINEINADKEGIKATQEYYADVIAELGEEKRRAAMKTTNACNLV